MAARSRSSPTLSAWTRAASCAVGAGCCCRRFSFAAGPPDPCPEEAPEASGRRSRRRRQAPPGAEAGGAGSSPAGAGAGRRPRTKRKRFTGWPGATSSIRRRICGPRYVSSLAQTDDAHSMVSCPRRKALGRVPPVDRVADGARPRGVCARLIAGRQPVQRRGEDFSQPARQVAARGLRPPRPRPALARALVLLVRRAAHSASRSGGAGGALVERRRRLAGGERAGQRELDHHGVRELVVGEVVPVGRRDDGLARRGEHAHQKAAARVVELAHDVVEEEGALLPGARRREPLLREEQRKDGGALLALRAEEPQVADRRAGTPRARRRGRRSPSARSAAARTRRPARGRRPHRHPLAGRRLPAADAAATSRNLRSSR